MIYAHYAVMGGFVIDVGHLSDTRTRVTLSHKAVAFLAKYGHFLAMEENVIRDKSKANLLAKTLVCAQVGWQLINTLARVIDGLPLTLLELHVLVHIVCAICMFVLWWEKPLDVYVPTLVDPSGFQDLLALMLVRNYGFGEPALDMRTGCPSPSSSIAKRVWVTNINREQSDRSEAAYLELFGTLLGEGNQPVPAGADDIGIMGDDVTEEPDFVIKTSSKKVSVGCTLQSGQSLSCGIGPAAEVHTPQGDSTAIAQSATRAASRGTLRILLSERDVRRWNLAATALERTHDGDSLKPASFFFETYVPNIFLVCKGMQAGHLYGYFLSWASGGLAAALSLCVVYGGVHLLAWNFDFPTAIERLLWRVACLDTVSGVCSLLTLFHATVYIHEHGFQSLLRAARSWEPGVLPCLFRIILAIGFLNIPFFMASRAFVVVETFVSLRRVPKAAYDTVKWSAYIPHF
ncbi:MAG: hypothetical protein M1823_002433 [Watsoniomyces obsoletus]|nr:MAG: hypothetical protein M1823_002433 [Watsoniomyces obsoletus]